MNINYHYFAIKVLTTEAGFVENDAQLLAAYSQFVDDFDTYRYLYFTDVPNYAQYLAVKIPTGWIFNPVTTGFNSFFDYARLMIESNQRKILIPFHFITTDPLYVVKSDRKDYRCQPVTMDKPSLLQSLLKRASVLYQNNQSRENLIRIGTLLHTYADTYAHQRFSGFWNWENYAYLTDAVDNINYRNITSSYSPDLYYYVPSIGHPNVSTAPDDSYVSFTMLQQYDEGEKFPYKANYSRSNVLEFLKASREILNYLRSCRGLDKIDDDSWNTLSDKLTRGFLTSELEIPALIKHWSAIFPDIKFHYNKNDLLTNSFTVVKRDETITSTESNDEVLMRIFNNECNEALDNYIIDGKNDDFFRFNVIADSIRRSVDPEYVSKDDMQFKNLMTKSNIIPCDNTI